MDNIIESIYKSCDEKNANSVSVSCLIEFIKPYMPNNVRELNELQAQLDPESTDPRINRTFFQKVMSEWIANIEAANTNSSLSEFPLNFNQTFNSNMSQALSDAKSNNNNTYNEINLEEQVNRLKYQLNKATSELELVKQQLASCEDQNECLLADLTAKNKAEFREQHVNAQLNEREYEIEQVRDEASLECKRREQLERLLTNHEKQQERYLGQIGQLESENQQLKAKVQTLEKAKQEGRKTLCEMRDCLDLKDTEISTLMEVIENLKAQLEEKCELVNFYTNEHTFLKQRLRELEDLLNTRNNEKTLQENGVSVNKRRSSFNSPKLLSQISNPVTPSFASSPIGKIRNSSSPLNSSIESGNCSGVDVFSFGVVTKLRSPHTTLKEELAEVSGEEEEKLDVRRLLEVIKDQEDIKNSLWQNMKQLTSDNETLKDYKKEYEELVLKLEESDKTLQSFQKELSELRQKNLIGEIKKDSRKTELIHLVTEQLTNVEDNLQQQLVISGEVRDKLAMLNSNLQNQQTDAIVRLSRKLKRVELSLRREKLVTADLRRNLPVKKVVADKSIETDKDENIWDLRSLVDETVHPKKTNFSKQEIRMERMLEKKEKIEKDLANEKGINTKLTQKYRDVCTENEILKKDLEFYRDKVIKQTKSLKDLTSENRSLVENIQSLEAEITNLSIETQHLNAEKDKLIKNNNEISENLHNTLHRLAVEGTVINNLRLEIDSLLKRCLELEKNVEGEAFQHTIAKKELIGLRTTHSSFKQIQEELLGKIAEIENLKKQLEARNVEQFLSIKNRELKSAITNIFNRFKGDHYVDETLLINEGEGLEKEMILLDCNVEYVNLLFQFLCDKKLSILDEDEVTDHSEETIYESFECHEISVNEESDFVSCYSQLNQESLYELMPLKYDSFLDHLEMEDVDVRKLSPKEMEEKFATMALMLTVDGTSANRRCAHEQKRFNELISKFFAYLNYSLVLLMENSKNQKTAVAYLRQLKEMSEEVLQSAVERGVLHYEKRMANCWNFVINYVAMLSQQKKQFKQVCNESPSKSLEVQSLPPFSVIDDSQISSVNRSVSFVSYFRLFFSKRFKSCVCVFFLVLVVSFCTLLFYVDQICSKTNKRVCPLQWFYDFFVKKTYYDFAW